MAFDNTDPIQLAALNSEVTEDPIGIGYSAVINNTRAVLEKLNDPAQNVGGETINRPIEELTISEVAGVIDSVEYDALSAYDKEWVKMFITRPLGENLTLYQTKFLALFGPASDTRNAANALRVKNASRAEILFGVNTFISRVDWVTARDF